MIPAGTTVRWLPGEVQRLPSLLPLSFDLSVTELSDGGRIFPAIYTTHEKDPKLASALHLPLTVV